MNNKLYGHITCVATWKRNLLLIKFLTACLMSTSKNNKTEQISGVL